MIHEILTVMVALCAGMTGALIAAHLAPRTARPPRHARPKGWTGPAERAPFPPVASDEARSWIYPQDVEHYERHGMSPLNREVVRTRFRVMWWQAQGRPVV